MYGLARYHDRSHLAVDDLIRVGDPLLQRGCNSYHLERRTRLIDIAHRTILE